MTELYKKVEIFVEESFLAINRTSTLEHLKNTVNWVKKLEKNPSEALLIAAISHDIDRAFTSNELNRKSFIESDYLKRHQESSARIIADFLEKEHAEQSLITRAKFLVSNHELGGDEEQNILKDADRLSFFDRDLSKFVERHIKLDGLENVKEKFEWNFANITSKEAKEIARPMYEEALRILEGEK